MWSSSVSMARFVTIGAIDLKLRTYYYYVGVTHRPNFGPVWFLAWPPGGQNQKRKCYDSWTNSLQIVIIGTSNNDTWHTTRVFDSTYFWRLQLIGQSSKSDITPELMAGSSQSFYHRYNSRIHDIKPGFLIWPTFQGHRGQSSKHIAKLACFVTRADFVKTLRVQ
jgi:hypothetical protein